MERYIHITLNLSLLEHGTIDLRIPSTMTLKEMLQIVFESYRVDATVLNPTARILQTGKLLSSTNVLEDLKDGMFITLETV